MPSHATKVWEQQSAIVAKNIVATALNDDDRYTRREGIELYLYTSEHPDDISDYISGLLDTVPYQEVPKCGRFEIHQEPKNKCFIS